MDYPAPPRFYEKLNESLTIPPLPSPETYIQRLQLYIYRYTYFIHYIHAVNNTPIPVYLVKEWLGLLSPYSWAEPTSQPGRLERELSWCPGRQFSRWNSRALSDSSNRVILLYLNTSRLKIITSSLTLESLISIPARVLRLQADLFPSYSHQIPTNGNRGKILLSTLEYKIQFEMRITYPVPFFR